MLYLKDIIFSLFAEYNDYYEIIDKVRSLATNGDITSGEYDTILQYYSQWLDEWEEQKNAK